MAFRPALTCCIAWLPVRAPSEFTKGSVLTRFHSFSAPRLTRVWSICSEPRRRTTSAAEYVRLTPFQRGFSAQSFSRAAICWSRVSWVMVRPSGVGEERGGKEVFVGLKRIPLADEMEDLCLI